MAQTFQRIGLFAKPTGDQITQTLEQVYNFLAQRNLDIVIEESAAQRVANNRAQTATADNIGAKCDLAIVIGGDGSILKAARAVVNFDTPILGINRGSLGFLADLATQNIEDGLTQILNGNYNEEQRTMLHATIEQDGQTSQAHLALNDAVLHHGGIARLVEFKIFIDGKFVVEQRADGVITSTPTGSTAYALSGGGPIVYPTLDVLTLMPMFPHALNTRPIVINKNSKIKLEVSKNNRNAVNFSCDGQTHLTINPGSVVNLQANPKNLRLLHPNDYEYFAVLREKLGWNS